MPEFLCAGGYEVREGRAKPIGPHATKYYALAIFAQFKNEGPEYASIPEWAEDLFDPTHPGSLSHFYDAMSFGQFSVRGECARQWYTADHPATFYVKIGSIAAHRFGAFILSILRSVDRDVDFGRFDNDGPDGVPNSGDDDGYVDLLFINLRSAPEGFLEGQATGIAGLGFEGEYVTDDPARAGGFIRLDPKRGSTQRARTFAYAVGAMAHEMGHLLGLPDLYDSSFVTDPEETPDRESAGIGKWGLMGHGASGWNRNDGPTPFCAWSREQLGWIGVRNEHLVEITGDIEGMRLGDVETGGKVLKVRVGRSEYFLVENRQPSGGYYDRAMPKGGLLIWHIEGASTNANETRKLVDLECADGRYADRGYPKGRKPDPVGGRDNLDFWSRDEIYREIHRGNLGDGTDVFDGERYRWFSSDTNPGSNTAKGEPTGLAISNLRFEDGEAVFDLHVASPVLVVRGAAYRRPGERISGSFGERRYITPGDTAELDVFLANEGGITAPDVQVLLRTSDPYITLVDSARNFGDIPPEEVRGGSFRFLLSASLMDSLSTGPLGKFEDAAKYTAAFDIEATDARGRFWSYVVRPSLIVSETGAYRPRRTTSRIRDVIVSRRYVPVGDTAQIVFMLPLGEPDSLLVLFQHTHDKAAMDSLLLSGDEIERLEGNVPRYIVRWVPTVEADFGVRFIVRDQYGYTTSAWMPDAFTSRRFVRSSDLLVYASTGQQAYRYYRGLLNAQGVEYDFWDHAVRGVVPPEVVLRYADGAVIWGQASSRYMVHAPRSFVQDREDDVHASLRAYLDAGGRLFIPTLVVLSDAFCRDYLLADRPDVVWNRATLTGSSGDPVTDGLRVEMSGYAVLSLRRPAESLFSLGDGEAVGVRVDTGAYRLLYTGFPLEKVEDPEILAALLKRGLAWLTAEPLSLDHDLVIEDIVAPAERTERVPTRPMLRVRNQGASPEFATVSCTVERSGRTVYDATREVRVPVSESAVVAFPEWLPNSPGRYECRFRIELPGDEHPADNEHIRTVWVTPFSGIEVPNAGGSRGVAFGDCDNDGDLDLYVTRWGPADAFYWNDGGAFVEAAPDVHLGRVGRARGVAFGDYDNDGNLDLYIGVEGSNLLYRNDGNGSFSDVASHAGVADRGLARGVAFVDYDADGRLDLYIVNDDAANCLYRNLGDGTFLEVGVKVGVADSGKGRSAVFGDDDNDGDVDLYVANWGTSRLYRNEGDGTFSDVSDEAGATISGLADGATFGDYDNDGDLDLYVVGWDVHALLRNNGDGTFSDVSASADIPSKGKGVSAVFFDYDNDGHLDLYVTHLGPNALYRNEGDGTFSDRSYETGLDDPQDNFGVAVGDWDGDGRMDLCATGADRGVLYHNDGNRGSWLTVRTIGTMSNRDGIGARIRAVSGGISRIREVRSGSGYCSQSSLWVTFGLGSVARVDSLIVRWPSGIVDVLTDVTVNRRVEVTEGRGVRGASIENGSGADLLCAFELRQNRPNPFNARTSIEYRVPVESDVEIVVYDARGGRVDVLTHGRHIAGTYVVEWNAARFGSGVYFYHMTAGGFARTRRMVVLR